MPRYERREESFSTFWEVELDIEGLGVRSRAFLNTRQGNVGASNCESTTEPFDSTFEAQRAYDKLVAAIVKKGYAIVEAREEDVCEDAQDLGANPVLEGAILENVDDPAGYLVYGDWLQARGDPRGELIAVQGALLTKPASWASEQWRPTTGCSSPRS